MVRELDEGIGLVLGHLDASGLSAGTLARAPDQALPVLQRNLRRMPRPMSIY
jgi:hypothetical protein